MPQGGAKKNILTEKQKAWLVEFMNWADMTYTTSGRKDFVYISKMKGVSQCKTRHHLLWSLRDALSIMNEDLAKATKWFLRRNCHSHYSISSSRNIRNIYTTSKFPIHLAYVKSVKTQSYLQKELLKKPLMEVSQRTKAIMSKSILAIHLKRNAWWVTVLFVMLSAQFSQSSFSESSDTDGSNSLSDPCSE